MLTVIRDNNDDIMAVCEWRRCDKDGTHNKYGECIWIAELEVSKRYRNMNLIKNIIRDIDSRADGVNIVYFWRSKYKKRIREYSKQKFVEFARGNKCLA